MSPPVGRLTVVVEMEEGQRRTAIVRIGTWSPYDDGEPQAETFKATGFRRELERLRREWAAIPAFLTPEAARHAIREGRVAYKEVA